MQLVLATKLAKTSAFEFDAVGTPEVSAGVVVEILTHRALETNKIILAHNRRTVD